MKEDNIIVFEKCGSDDKGDIYRLKKFNNPMSAFRYYVENMAERMLAVRKEAEVIIK